MTVFVRTFHFIHYRNSFKTGSAPLNDETCHVFITVASHWFKSSVKNDGLQGLQTRQLEVNWDTASCGPKLHSVFLFSDNPSSAK
jgi:hypothetical protein